MFERFTEPARQAVVLAQEEARALGHGHIGTEHQLLGLLRLRDEIPARVLEPLGVTLAEVRAKVVVRDGRGAQPPAGRLPFTWGAKRAFALTPLQAQAMRHETIGTGHLLLGLLAAEDAATAILRDCGVGVERAREAVSNAVRSR